MNIMIYTKQNSTTALKRIDLFQARNRSADMLFYLKNLASIKIKSPSLWQRLFKRLLDISIAVTGLIILFPLFVYIALRIKWDSKGPVFYFQERIGLRGRRFSIFKFRSMYPDSEMNGPSLSFPDDKRVTKWGRTMRKWKLDELPQLFNIFLGHMSLVGPRPERQFYIDKVSVKYPYFNYLHQVKPGLTSLGIIKFGYAQNIEQITERLKYDITYLENYSLVHDVEIIYYTLLSLIKGTIRSASPKPVIFLPIKKVAHSRLYS
jgi:lipopolysaccharide/colanic/teichoic acid biosynthesis glycosyltransferase